MSVSCECCLQSGRGLRFRLITRPGDPTEYGLPECDRGTRGCLGPLGTRGCLGPLGTRGGLGPLGTRGGLGPLGTRGGLGPLGTVKPYKINTPFWVSGVQPLYCGVQSLYCGVQSFYCGVQSLYCGVQSLYCGVQSLYCGVQSFYSRSPRPHTATHFHGNTKKIIKLK
jgi:hypothetical protein